MFCSMAIAAAATTCCFSLLASTAKFRGCSSSQRHLSLTSQLANHHHHHHHHHFSSRRASSSSNPPHSTHRKTASLKKVPRNSNNDKYGSCADKNNGRREMEKPQSVAYRSFGTSRKETKEFQLNLKEDMVETGNLEYTAFLNAVVKVYCTHTAPDYSLPWQRRRQYTSTGSAFMIGDKKLLTNAHCVEYDTQVKVKRRGDDTKYVAKVLARGVDCDIALLSVENEEFWEGVEPLQLGQLPHLQAAVTVVGYPLGGDTISVTKGVVSRIEVIVVVLHSMIKGSALEWHFRCTDLMMLRISAM